MPTAPPLPSPRLQHLAEELDLAAYLAGHGDLRRRRAGLARADRVEAVLQAEEGEEAAALREEIAAVRAVAIQAARDHRRHRLRGAGSTLTALAASAVGILILQGAWKMAEEALLLEVPRVEVDPIERVVYVPLPVLPLEGDPAPGEPAPQAREDAAVQAFQAPPQPEVQSDTPPEDTLAPGVGGNTGEDVARTQGEPTPTGALVLTPETPEPPRPDAPPQADTQAPDTVLLAAPGEEEGPPTSPPAPARLPAGSQDGYRALADLEDMDFRVIGGGAAPTKRRLRGGGGLFQVSNTEVTQAQWAAVMGLDLSSVSGHWDHPAEALSWCDALRFANKLSAVEGFRPAYRVDDRCEQGGPVRWDTRANGFRLLTEQEWLGLAGSSERGALDRIVAETLSERENNRGLGPVESGGAQRAHGLTGVADNAREWVWGALPGEGVVPEDRWQQAGGDTVRAVVRGCGAFGEVVPTEDDPWCRSPRGPADVPLGAGLRLARGRTPVPEES